MRTKGSYIILDIETMDYMKDKEGNVNLYETLDEAKDVCGIYEFQNVWILKLVHNYIE